LQDLFTHLHGVDEANSGMWFMRILIGKLAKIPIALTLPLTARHQVVGRQTRT